MAREAVIGAMVEHAFEIMISFHNVIRKDFNVQWNTADSCRALYLYKHRHYNELLNLCELFLRGPDLQSNLKKFSCANVLVLPTLYSLFDKEVKSLFEFNTLFYYLTPLDNDLQRVEGTPTLGFNTDTIKSMFILLSSASQDITSM